MEKDCLCSVAAGPVLGLSGGAPAKPQLPSAASPPQAPLTFPAADFGVFVMCSALMVFLISNLNLLNIFRGYFSCFITM